MAWSECLLLHSDRVSFRSRPGTASSAGSMLQCWKAAIFADGAVRAHGQSMGMAWHGMWFIGI